MSFVEGKTQREIAKLRGISQMQVSRMLRRITSQLHDQLVGDSEHEELVPAS